jgi:branched-chain amino acid aminotransferase
MSQPLAYRNGQFIPASQLTISVADAGFVFGATASEFVRTFNGQLFRLSDHFERLWQSCELCRIPLVATKQELTDAAERLVANNFLLDKAICDSELALIIFATPGPLAHYSDGSTGPTLAMHTFPLNFDRYRPLFEHGARLIVPPIQSTSAIDPRAKMRSRLHWWIAQQQAHDVDPEAWALLVDPGGYVTETAAANFLIVRNGVVISPPRSTILNGVSLRVTEELCVELGFPFHEQTITVSDCQCADEAMLTGTAFGLAGVRAINGCEIRWPGPMTLRLLEKWNGITSPARHNLPGQTET